MRIIQIKVQNFGLIESADIHLENNALAIFGMNGQAKTTIINAMHWTLFGWCEHTDRRGAGARDLIRDGATTAEVEVHFTHGEFTGFAAATIGRKENTFDLIDDDGVIVEGIKSRDGFWDHLNIDPRVALLAAMPLEILWDKANNQVLADYLSRSITAETVLAQCGDHAEQVKYFAKSHRLPLRHVEDFRNIGDVAYTARTEVNRELKQAKAEHELLSVTVQPTRPDGEVYTVADVPAVQSGLKTARNERDALIARRTVASGSAGDIDAARAEVADAKQQAEAMRADVPVLEKSIAEITAELDAAVEANNEASRAANATHQEKERLTRTRREIAAMEPGCECPTCQRKLTEKQQATVLDALDRQLAEAAEAHEKTLAVDTETRQALNPIRERLSTVREKLKTHETALSRVEAVASKQLPQPYNGPSVEQLQAEIDDLDAQINRGERVLKQLQEMQQAETAEKRVEYLTGQSAVLDWIVEAFKKGAVIGGLIDHELAAFASVCNEELLPLGFHLDFTVDGKNITPILQCPSKPPRRAGLCSRSERTLAAWAIACGFGRTGVPVMLDDIDGFDAQRRTEFLYRLAEYQAGTAVVAGAWQQPDVDAGAVAEALPGVTVAWCDMGVVNVLNAAVAA